MLFYCVGIGVESSPVNLRAACFFATNLLTLHSSSIIKKAKTIKLIAMHI